MIEASVSKLKASLSEFLNRVVYQRERVVVLSRGKPKAAVIGIEDLRLFEELEDAQAARDALEEHARGATVTLEQFEAELAGTSVGVQG